MASSSWIAAVPHGCSLIINIGTTTEAIARELLRHKGLRVITNNLNVAAILSAKGDVGLHPTPPETSPMSCDGPDGG